MGQSIGIPGLIIILVLALVLFGPKKLPELGRAVGNTLREFKMATRNLASDDEEDGKEPKKIEAVMVKDSERDKVEKEIRERLERERLEKEIREKLEQERLHAEKQQNA